MPLSELLYQYGEETIPIETLSPLYRIEATSLLTDARASFDQIQALPGLADGLNTAGRTHLELPETFSLIEQLIDYGLEFVDINGIRIFDKQPMWGIGDSKIVSFVIAENELREPLVAYTHPADSPLNYYQQVLVAEPQSGLMLACSRVELKPHGNWYWEDMGMSHEEIVEKIRTHSLEPSPKLRFPTPRNTGSIMFSLSSFKHTGKVKIENNYTYYEQGPGEHEVNIHGANRAFVRMYVDPEYFSFEEKVDNIYQKE